MFQASVISSVRQIQNVSRNQICLRINIRFFRIAQKYRTIRNWIFVWNHLPDLDTLNQYTPAVVITDRWYKKDNVPFAYSLSFLPIELIAEKQIDLTHPDELLHYLESDCYKTMASCHRICSYTTTGNFTADKYAISEHDSFLLIQENIYDENGRIQVSSKHYIPAGLFRIELSL